VPLVAGYELARTGAPPNSRFPGPRSSCRPGAARGETPCLRTM
ncbi:MAG: hypothetical protein AVDCRST_MAG41-2055, partial [uncultured Corynebacteriales bacterium]